MASKFDWHGPAVQAAIRAEMARRLSAATVIVLNRARELLSVSGTSKGAAGRNAKGQFQRVYGANPSLPGEPPRKQRGHLRRSLAREVNALVGRVGTNLNYGRWLELGTKKMAARPWLRRALTECRAAIRSLISKPIP